ncbi:MAG: hypothetical protein ABEL76_14945, partial [Bradymonadaceae bacterium]
GFVGIEWLTRGVAHGVLAVVSGFSILFGIQLIMFGVLSDLLLSLHREQMDRLEPVYGSGAELTVQPEAELQKLQISEHGRLETSSCSKGPCRTVVVRATNSRAGHLLPTGDPERHIDIHAVVRGPEGSVLTAAEQRIASRYEWWPEIEKKYDNRLAPGESIDVPLRIPIDHGPVWIDVVASKYRMYPEAFEHHDLQGRYVRGRTFHRSTWRLSVDGKLTRLYQETDMKTEGRPPDDAFRHHDLSYGAQK